MANMPPLPSNRWRSQAVSTRAWIVPVLYDNRAEGSPRLSSESFVSGFHAGYFDVGVDAVQQGTGACPEFVLSVAE